MIDYYYCYTKKKSEVGKKCQFEKSTSQVVGRIEANEELKKRFMLKENIYYNDDNTKKQSEQYVNIESLKLDNKFFYHSEGGWTKDIDTSEAQNKMKYIRRMEKDINLINSLKIIMNETTKILNKNISINIYEEYFKNDISSKENFKIKSVLVLKDSIRKYKRLVSCLKWSTDSSYKMAVSYTVNNCQKISNNVPKNCVLYDLNRNNVPYQTLYCKSFIKCLRFNHKNSDLLIGGAYDGTINLWDLRKKNTFCESSPPSISHKSVVHDLVWLQSKTNNQCLTISNDGLCLIWDIRNFSEVVETLHLTKDPGETESLDSLPSIITNTDHSYYNANCLEWNLEAGPSKILVGTDEGYILCLSKRQGKNLEVVQKYGMSQEKHVSSICSIKRIPINLKYFLSTDRWGFNIWSEDVKFPIISNFYGESVINKGLWIHDSPFFILTRNDGYLDFWNFLYDFNRPIIKHKISNFAITHIEPHIHNQHLALGSEDGDIHILKLGQSFCKHTTEEKNALDELFERESKREKNLEYIRKQLNCVKAKKQCLNIQDVTIDDEILKRTEMEYLSLL